MRVFSRACGVVALIGVTLVGSVAAQGTTTVSGQVTILERPGETTEDLGDVVVYLEPLGATARLKPLTPTNSVINLEKRQFQPHVRVIVMGSKVEFPNQDPFSHNVFSKANGGFDTQAYGRGKTRDNVFSDAGVYPLYCNVHPRMSAYVIALSTPYFVQANLDGTFKVEGVPPGAYRLHVWHDRTTEMVRDVTVPATGVKGTRVELDGRGYRYVQHKNKFGQDYTSTAGDRY